MCLSSVILRSINGNPSTKDHTSCRRLHNCQTSCSKTRDYEGGGGGGEGDSKMKNYRGDHCTLSGLKLVI